MLVATGRRNGQPVALRRACAAERSAWLTHREGAVDGRFG